MFYSCNSIVSLSLLLFWNLCRTPSCSFAACNTPAAFEIYTPIIVVCPFSRRRKRFAAMFHVTHFVYHAQSGKLLQQLCSYHTINCKKLQQFLANFFAKAIFLFAFHFLTIFLALRMPKFGRFLPFCRP